MDAGSDHAARRIAYLAFGFVIVCPKVPNDNTGITRTVARSSNVLVVFPFWRRQGLFDPRAGRWHVRDNALGQIAHQQCSFESYWAGLGLQGAKPFTQDIEHGAIGNGHEILPSRSGELLLMVSPSVF